MLKSDTFFNKINTDEFNKFSAFQGNGLKTKEAESKLQNLLSAPKAILTPSCTAALEMASLIIDINHCDEVIVPSYTFVTSASAFAMRGAKIIYVDVNEGDFNSSFQSIKNAISKKTKAVVYVDYGGAANEIDKIKKLCSEKNIFLIEDAAQAIGASYSDKMLGTFGDLATFSFHETKNIHCGEGGALIINNKSLIDKALIIRDKGTNRENYNLGIVNKYEWVAIGSSFLVSEFQAAILSNQLDFVKEQTVIRKKIFDMYFSKLAELEEKNIIKRQKVDQKCFNNGHLFFILINNGMDPEQIIKNLSSRGIGVTTHYVPLHTSSYGSQFFKNTNLAVTNQFADRLLRLPINPVFTEEDINLIVSEVTKVLGE